MANLAQIYDWFMTAKKPTQAQFWASWGSFWNKEESIPQSAISNLTTVLNAKTENDQFNAHKVAEDAHAAILVEPNARITALEAKTDSSNNFKFIPNPGYSFDPATLVLTMAAGWIGTINDEDYTNVATQEFPAIALSNAGYSRIELIVFKEDGSFEKLVGAQSTATPVAPVQPSNTLQAMFLTVGDGVVSVPVTPKPKAPVTSVNGMRGDVLIEIATATDTAAGMVKTDVTSPDPVVYLKTTADNLLKAKVNAILEIKPITGIAYALIAYDTANLVQLAYDGTLPMTVTIPNDATLNLPVGSIFYTVASNTGALTITGGAGVTFQTAVGLTAGQNETRKYVKKAANKWGVEGGSVPLVPTTTNIVQTYYVDTINGNNATAQAGNINKPYKTIDPIFAFCGYSEPFTYNNIILLTNGTYYINSVMAQYGQINFISDKKVTISFENNTNAQLLLFAAGNNYYKFNIPYGKIIFSNTVDQYFSGDNWEIICDEFYTSYGTSTIFQNTGIFKFRANKTTLKKGLCISNGVNSNYYICPNTVITGTNVHFIQSNGRNTLIDVRGGITGTGNLSLSKHSGETYVGDITLTGTLTIGAGDIVITFFNSKLLVTTIYVATDNSGQVTLSGVVHPSSIGMSISYTVGTTLIFKDFTHDFKNIIQNMSASNYIFENVNLSCDTVFFTRNVNGKTHKMYGINSFYSRSPSVLMNGTFTSTIEDYGDLRTNIPSLGTTVTYFKKNTALMFLPSFTDDAAAASAGLTIGFEYINSTTGALHRRLT